jgi:hypothetical protein
MPSDSCAGEETFVLSSECQIGNGLVDRRVALSCHRTVYSVTVECFIARTFSMAVFLKVISCKDHYSQLVLGWCFTSDYTHSLRFDRSSQCLCALHPAVVQLIWLLVV